MRATRKRSQQRQKVGLVSLRYDSKEQRWKASYSDPATGSRHRERLPVATEEEALAWSIEQNRCLLEGKGVRLPGIRPRREGLAIRQALMKAIATSRGQAKHRGRLLDEAEHFMRWVELTFAHVRFWEQVNREVWRAYDTQLQDEDLSRDGLKHRWEILRKASAFWADEAPDLYHDHLRACKIKLPPDPWREPPILTLKQLIAFLAWTETEAPDLWPLVALAGLAGAREYEGAFAREVDVNIVAGKFRVDESNVHLPKNAYSYRTVTLCKQLVDILRRYAAKRKVRAVSPDEGFFLHRDGRPWTERRLERRWETVMTKARKAGIDMPTGFCARHFRHTFCSLTEFDAGVNRQALLRYTGRAPEGILGKKYQRLRPQKLHELLTLPWQSWLNENWNKKEEADSDQAYLD